MLRLLNLIVLLLNLIVLTLDLLKVDTSSYNSFVYILINMLILLIITDIYYGIICFILKLKKYFHKKNIQHSVESIINSDDNADIGTYEKVGYSFIAFTLAICTLLILDKFTIFHNFIDLLKKSI